jgi:hypothetical protein
VIPSRIPPRTFQKVGLFVGSLVLALSMTLLVYYVAANHRPPESAVPSPFAEGRQYDKFQFSGVKSFEYDGYGGLTIKLSADSIIHRKRKSKFFEYQNLKELYLDRAVLDLYPGKEPSLAEGRCLPFALLAKSINLVPGAGPARSIESYLQETGDIDLDILSRVLFDDFSLNIHYPTGRFLAITAEKAWIGGDFQSLVLEGAVRVISTGGEVVRASRAVVSRRFDGILLPSGYLRQEVYQSHQAFFRLTAEGRLAWSSRAPRVEYGDQLEAKENEFYGRILGKIPPYQRVMFGLPAR